MPRVLRTCNFADFDPNDVDSSYKLWAIWTGSTFKTYNGRGPAIAAFKRWEPAKLYEYVPNEGWVLRAHKPPHPDDICTTCQGEVKSTYDTYPWQGYYHWLRVNGKITSPPELLYLCKHCAKVYT